MKKEEKVEIEKLFKELKSENKEILEELYNKLKHLVYCIAFSMLKNKDDSEDIMQSVFLKIYNLDKDKLPIKNELTWLYTVTKNEVFSFLKKKNEHIDIEDIYDLEDKNNEIEELINVEKYNELISKLNDKEKEIVSLKIVSNLSFEEISQLLGEKTSTIKWRYYKSLHTLKLLLTNLTMFIVTFMTGIFALKNGKKISKEELKQEISEDKAENIEDISGDHRDEASKSETKNEIMEDKTQESIVIEESVTESNTNYLGFGILGVSTIFFVFTIIFAIILKKHQLNAKKKSSK